MCLATAIRINCCQLHLSCVMEILHRIIDRIQVIFKSYFKCRLIIIHGSFSAGQILFRNPCDLHNYISIV